MSWKEPIEMDRAEAYLLGKLPEDERTRAQRQVLNDAAFHQQVLEAETDLIDAYARGQLDPATARLVEDRLLAVPENRSRLQFARHFTQWVDEESASSLPATAGWDGYLSRISRPLSLAVAALLLIGLLGLWLSIRDARLAAELDRVSRLAASLQEDLAGRASQASGAGERPSRAPGRGGGSLVLAVELDSRVRRSQSAAVSLKVQSDIDVLELHLGLDPADRHPSYSVILRSPSGETVFSRQDLLPRVAGGVLLVPVRLPVAALADGRYEVELQQDDAPLEFYYFDLTRLSE